jgi:3-hydroxyacyl-CoA dehydrogenase
MKLVEVIRAQYTSQETFDTLWAVAKKMGKVPVSAKDTPGYVPESRLSIALTWGLWT